MQRDAADVFARLITERTAMPTADDHAAMVAAAGFEAATFGL
jgi:hypothetical protein